MRILFVTSALCLLLSVVPALGDEPASPAPFDAVSAVGLEVGDTPEAGTVVSVLRDSPAGRAGFEVGDRILKLGDEGVGAPYASTVAALLEAARKTSKDNVTLTLVRRRGGVEKRIPLDLSLRELDVSVAVTRALDYLAAELASDPTYEKSRPRAFYAPIIYAPLAGLAFVANGSTRSEGRYAEALQAVLAYVMKHGGRRKENQDEINKAVRGNICSLTHNAGFSAMFLAQLIDSERSSAGGAKLRFSKQKLRGKLGECCRTLEELQLENGGWQHGSGGPNMLRYTHLMAATVTAMNGLAMAKQVGVKVKRAVIDRGVAYIRAATKGGQVGYAVGNRGSFSAGRNAGVLQILDRLGLPDDELVKPVGSALAKQVGTAGTGHGSPLWHLFYVGLAAPRLAPEMREVFDGLYRARLLAGQQADGSIRAPEPADAKPVSSEENRIWGPLYTTPLIVLALQAPYHQRMLLYRFGASAE